MLGLSSELKATPEGFKTYYQQRQVQLDTLEEGSIEIQIDCSGTCKRGEVLIKVIDSGKGYDYHNLTQNKVNKSYSGRGLFLVNQLCDKVNVSKKGNKVEALFRCAPQRSRAPALQPCCAH